MEVEQSLVTVRMPRDLAERVRALATREMTQGATIWRRVARIGLSVEEARLDAEDAALTARRERADDPREAMAS